MASTSREHDQISLCGEEEEENNTIVVPLEYVIQRIHVVCDDIQVEEGGLFAISKAVEFFTRYLIQVGSIDKTSEITYDSIAEVINLSNFSTLKDFFPRRQIYGEIADKVAQADVIYQDQQRKEE